MSLAVWAGIECTINRVGDRFISQCTKNGHIERIEDLELFANLGIKKIRYPFLWEMAAPNSLSEFNWSWMDERISEMQRLGLTPIAGLLHHGSGPQYTNLLDPDFPEKFETYATAFAERYPWITDYTPINEPLTTARFSGLYGVWYPHGRTDAEFLRALYNQIKGIILAMRRIRNVNTQAQLIQTEDLGRAQGTEPLQYQVQFENERRWLSIDLLCGRVDPEHKLYNYLIENGLTESELRWLSENLCPPDIFGINHYLLSNRFLDHRLEFYPESYHGGNGRVRYADIGAIDTTAATAPLPESIFQEAWDRYQIPLAVTEVHVNGTRESQMRWLYEIWSAATKLKQKNVDFRAVTAWSLLGSYDWNVLCTECNHYYESGVFDIRSTKPRPTALAKMLRDLANHETFEHPLLDRPGWWHSPNHPSFGPDHERAKVELPSFIHLSRSSRPLLLTGATGTLGKAFARICEHRNIPYKILRRSEMDICEFESVRRQLELIKPWAVINAAGYVRVDEAESDSDRCFRENVLGPRNLAIQCQSMRIPLLTFSSDLVFDGKLIKPYLENHPVSPLNVYGRSKAESERQVLEICEKSLVVRTSSFFGPWDEYNFITLLLRSLSSGKPFEVAQDITISPTYVPDLVHTCLDLLIDGEKGILHLVNSGQVTWAQLANTSLEIAKARFASNKNFNPELMIHRLSHEMNFRAPRPIYSALDTERARIMPHYEDALERYFNELEIPIESHLVNVVGGPL